MAKRGKKNSSGETSQPASSGDSEELTAALLQSLGESSSTSPSPQSDPPSDDLGDEDGDWGDVLDSFPSMETPKVTPDAVAAALQAGVDDVAEAALGFYRREADAILTRDSNRAALMLLEAALAGERGGLSADSVQSVVEDALALEGLATWLLPAVRRLFLRLDRRAAALKLCDTEVEVADDPQRKAAVLLEASALEHHVRRQPDKALELVKRALDIDERHVSALTRALGLHIVLAQRPAVAATLERLSDAIATPSERALLLYSAGSVREGQLKDLDGAESAYRHALEANHEQMPASLALAALQRRRADWTGLIRTLEPLIELTPDAAGQSHLLCEQAAIRLDHGLDPELATRALRRAIDLVPPDTETLLRLIDSEGLQGDLESLIDACERLLALRTDAVSQAELHTRIGRLQVDLEAYEDAVASFRAALEVKPLHTPAVEALRQLLTELQRFDELVALVSEWAHAEGIESDERAGRMQSLAELNTALGQYDEAVAAYREALSAGFHSPFWGLNRLLLGLERYEERAALLREHIAQTTDQRTTNHLLSELARVLAGPLDDVDAAADALGEAKNPYNNRGLELERIELLLDARRYEELADSLVAQADDTKDKAERHGWLLQAARVAAEALEDAERAADLVRTVLKEAPGHSLAVAEMVRLARSQNLESVLIEAHEHVLEHRAGRCDALELYREIGDAHGSEGRLKEATEAYLAAQAIDPAEPGIAWKLERLLRRQERWPDLVEMLELYATAVNDLDGSYALCRAGDLAYRVIGDAERADKLYNQATDMAPENLRARYLCVDVAQHRKKWKPAVVHLDALIDALDNGEERSRALLQRCRLRELWLGETPDVASVVEASEQTRFEPQLRFELTRMRMASNADDLGPWLHTLGTRTMDAQLAAAWFMESAHLSEFGDKSDGALESADEAYKRLPDDLGVIWCMERVLHRANDHKRLARIRERAAHMALDPEERVQTLSGAILPYLDAELLDEGGRVARECLNFSAHSLPALLALADLAESAENWAILAGHCDRLAEACQDPDNRFSYRIRAARLWADEVKDSSRALASLNVALSHDATYAPAFDMAKRLLGERAEFDELSRLYRRHINAVNDSKKVSLLLEHAQLLQSELVDPARASAELNRLLAIAPGHLEALSLQADLLGMQDRWAEAANTLHTLSSVAIDEKITYDALSREADIHIQHLRQPTKGRKILETLANDFPNDLTASWQLVDLAIDAREWDDARTLLEGVAERGTPEVRVKAMIQLAQIARRGIWEIDDLHFESGALLGALPTPTALEALVDQYRKREEIPRLIDIAKALLDAGVDAEEDRSLKETIAELLLEAGRNDEAAAWLGDVVSDDGDATWARLGRAQALEKQDKLKAAAEIYRTLIDEDSEIDTAYPGLIRVWDRLGEVDRANAASAVYELLSGEALEADDPIEDVPSRALDLSKFALDGEGTYNALFAAIDPYLPQLYPLKEPNTLPPQHELSRMATRLGQALGFSNVEVGLVKEAPLCSPAISTSPRIEVLRSFADKPAAEQTWHVAKALCLLKGSGALVSQLSLETLRTLVEALSDKRPDDPEARNLRKQILKMMPRAERKAYKAGVELPSLDWRAIRAAEERRADWVALLISRAPRVALKQAEATKGSPLVQRLLGDDYVDGLKIFWSEAQLTES